MVLQHVCSVGRIQKMEACMWAMFFVWWNVQDLFMAGSLFLCIMMYVLFVLCIHSFDVWVVSMCEAWPVFLLPLMSVSLCGPSSFFCWLRDRFGFVFRFALYACAVLLFVSMIV